MLQLQGDQRKVRTCRSADCLQQRCCGWLFCCSARAVASCLSLFAVASCLPACGCSAGRGHVAVAQPSCIRDAETDVAPAPSLAPPPCAERVGLPAGQPAVQEGPGQGARLLSSPAPLRPHRPGCLSGSWLARPPWPPTPPGGPCGRAATLRLGSALACAGWRRQQRWQEWRPEC